MKSVRLPARLRFLRSAPAGYAVDVLVLVSFTLFLSVWLDIRYPLPIEFSDHFLIALEVPVAFGVLALCQRIGLRLRWWVFGLLSIIGLLARLFETADNISHRFVYRDFRVPLDLHLVPEFFRLLYDTSPAPTLASYALWFALFLAGSLAIVALMLGEVYRRSRQPFFRRSVAGLLLLSVGLVATGAAGGPTLYVRDVSKRIGQEIRHVAKLPEDRKKILASIAEVQERIGNGTFLDKLQGNNVLIIFVESYGRTAFVTPRQRDLLRPRYEEMQKDLGAAGFSVASDFITSPTYGGFSWFAHSTLDSGVKVISHLHSQLLDEQHPRAFADYFRDAGYLPINVAPGTTRPWGDMEDYYGFHNHYYAWELGYNGPHYGWATMADQFVLDRIQHIVIEKSQQPLFLQFALISSHAPFNDIPHYIPDWSKIGDGSILHEAGVETFDTTWENPRQINEGYSAAIAYEMRCMEGFLQTYVKDDTLVIFMGDHQPHQQVTGPDNLTWSVPVHVVSRNPEFVAPFLRRGYIAGMIPDQPLPHVGMERFMEEFLSDFSTEHLAVDPGIWPPIQAYLEERAAKPH